MLQVNIIALLPALPSLHCHKGYNGKVKTGKPLLMFMIQHPFLTALILVFSFINEITAGCHLQFWFSLCCSIWISCLSEEETGVMSHKAKFNRICDLFILGTCIEKLQAGSCSSWVRDAHCFASVPCKTWKNVNFLFKFSTSCLHIANLARQFHKILLYFLLTVHIMSRNLLHLSLVVKSYSLKFQTIMWFSVWKFTSNVVHLYKASQSANRIFVLFSHAWSIMKLFPECF